MTTLPNKTVLLRVGSAKALTRSAIEGDLKEGLTSQQYYV